MEEATLTIGEVAHRAGVATSAVRYYERIGLLRADGRVSGQRRYCTETLRRLVFIGVLQDAGLSLEDIAGMVDASDRSAWQEIAAERLTELDAELHRLQRARTYLRGAMQCPYDHPLTECQVMGGEIDRRLATGAP